MCSIGDPTEGQVVGGSFRAAVVHCYRMYTNPQHGAKWTTILLLFQCVLLYGTPTKSEEDEAEATDHDESLYDDDVPIFTELNLDSFPAESISHMRVVIHSDGLSSPITVPVIVAKVRRLH